MTDETSPRAVEHPFDRRRRAIIGVAGLVLLALVFIVGGTVPIVEARNAAVTRYQAAVDDFTTASGRATDAATRLDAARAQVGELLKMVEPITLLAGEPVTPEATAALRSAVDTAQAAFGIPDSDGMGPSPADAGGLSTAQLLDAASALAQRTRGLVEEAATDAARAARADEAATALGTAVGDYLTALTQRGVALIAAHPGAGADAINAFRSALDAMPDADTAVLADRIAVLVALAQPVAG